MKGELKGIVIHWHSSSTGQLPKEQQLRVLPLREDLLYHGMAARPGKANAAPCLGDSCDLFRSWISAPVRQAGVRCGVGEMSQAASSSAC